LSAKRRSAKKKTGRPSAYRAEFNRQALNLAQLGATDADLARAFDVTVTTINTWKKQHPDFLASLKKGKDQADANVANSLYRRAMGWRHKAVKIFADPKTGSEKIVPYIEEYPGDTVAAIFWLKNRRPDLWRDKVAQEVTGANDGPLTVAVTHTVVDPAGA